MAILTLEQLRAANKQALLFQKTALVNSNNWWSSWPGTGTPGAGAGAGNTANGAVPTDATTGALPIADFTGNGYLSGATLEMGNANFRLWLVDRLFACGGYTVNTSTTLTSQPSYSSRVPGGTDYSGLEIWYENMNAGTGSPVITVTYTDQSGNTGHTTGAQAVNSQGSGIAYPLALAAGDYGVQKIESVAMTGGGAQTWNILVVRKLMMACLPLANTPYEFPVETVGLPEIYSDSCLMFLGFSPVGATNSITAKIDIASG